MWFGSRVGEQLEGMTSSPVLDLVGRSAASPSGWVDSLTSHRALPSEAVPWQRRSLRPPAWTNRGRWCMLMV